MSPTFERHTHRQNHRRTICFVAVCGLAAQATAFAQMPSPGDWEIPVRYVQHRNPLSATPQNVAAGKVIYLRECASCHGWTGNNDGANAPKEISRSRRQNDPSLWNDSDGALFFKITEGRAKMPPTRGVLSDLDRWQVVIYLRTLSPKPKS